MAGLIRYDNGDKVVDTQKIVTSTWSDNTNNAEVYFNFTSPATTETDLTSSAAFYREVYNDADKTETQFAIAYGNKKGSGSKDFTNDTGAHGNSAARVIYNQYRQLVYGDETSDFNFEGTTPDSICVININRARYKHNLKAGSLNLFLSGSDAGTLAHGTIHLTDDSVSTSGSATITNAGRQFNLVSGSSGVMLSGTTLAQTNSGSYGFFYPDSGFIILNTSALSCSLNFTESVGSHVNNDNLNQLMAAISGGASFIVDSEEKVTSQYFFTRAKNNEFNYTTNPSFIDTNGNLNYTSMVDNPKTFITTIGLYNDSNDLVAVAKVSQPIAKDFSKEALIRVKLDY
jgi:hypothetical protein